MENRYALRLLGWLVAIGLAVGTPALAHAAPATCHAGGSLGEPLGQVAAEPGRWTCGPARQSLKDERAYLSFEIDPGAERPAYFETRRAALAAIHLRVVDGNGTVQNASYTSDDLQQSPIGGFLRVPLPRSDAAPAEVIAAIDLPTHAMTLEQARLSTGKASADKSAERVLLLLAMLCGTMLMPLIFNLVFYRILRERFVLWHSALVLSLLVSIVLGSELAFYLVSVPVMTLSALNTLMFGLSVGSAGMFAHSFIEPGKLDARLRRALPWAAGWGAMASTLHAAIPFVGREIQSELYYLAFVPVLVVYLAAIGDALRKGSRAARYQALGWAPLVAVCLIRLASGLLPAIPNDDAMMLFYVGCVIEVLATTMGVADRVMAIKRQRDQAVTEATMHERLSERDALTGLMNRRALDDRFAELRAKGFGALAVLDLDRFKAINDDFGHAVGDEVLKAAAAALEADANLLAFRLGGEEFVLLLKGKDALIEAERRRQAITLHVARRIDAIDRPVTASVGVIELPPDAAARASFEELYARADKLLYEAKQAGRNRTISERLKLFVPRRSERRKAAA